MRYSGNLGHFFLVPNEIFSLSLSSGELAVYMFLKCCENRKTHQCYPSYKTIGGAVGMSTNTVKKYVSALEQKNLIATEPTVVLTKKGQMRNGNLLYHILPIDYALDYYAAKLMEQNECENERRKIQRLLKKDTA